MKEVRNHYGYPMLDRLDKEDAPAVHALYVAIGVGVIVALGYMVGSYLSSGVR